MPSQKPTAISGRPHLPGGSKAYKSGLVTKVPEPSSRTRSSAGRGISATSYRTPTAQGKKVPQSLK